MTLPRIVQEPFERFLRRSVIGRERVGEMVFEVAADRQRGIEIRKPRKLPFRPHFFDKGVNGGVGLCVRRVHKAVVGGDLLVVAGGGHSVGKRPFEVGAPLGERDRLGHIRICHKRRKRQGFKGFQVALSFPRAENVIPEGLEEVVFPEGKLIRRDGLENNLGVPAVGNGNPLKRKEPVGIISERAQPLTKHLNLQIGIKIAQLFGKGKTVPVGKSPVFVADPRPAASRVGNADIAPEIHGRVVPVEDHV